MSNKFQPVRGTQDIFGDESLKYHQVVGAAGKLANIYNYQALMLPVFEATEVFARYQQRSDKALLFTMPEMYVRTFPPQGAGRSPSCLDTVLARARCQPGTRRLD